MRIDYHLYHPTEGYQLVFGSLQAAVESEDYVISDDLLIVEITTTADGKRKKTGFFDAYGNETHPRPVGMPPRVSL